MPDALTLLRLQVEWGADEAIDAMPIDRLTPLPPARPTGADMPRETGAAPTLPPTRIPALPPTLGAGEPRVTPADRAATLAARATSLDALRETLAAFDGCALRDTASNLVFAEGDPVCSTLIVGEPPGREEDRAGHPFVGPDGALLDQMLGSIGLDRARVMLTPLLPWRPPGGRPPNAAEMAICLPFLYHLITLLGPSRMVIFGGTAARALLSVAQTRRRPSPVWVDFSMAGLQKTIPTLALPSLAEMLKTPSTRRIAWAGLRLLRRSINAELTDL